MKNSSRFFANKDCEYYPCHPGLEDFSCLFCYCPLNYVEHCPGNPDFIRTKDGRVIKNCMGCDFPHRPENYDIVINFIRKNMPVFPEELLCKKGEKAVQAEPPREEGKKNRAADVQQEK